MTVGPDLAVGRGPTAFSSGWSLGTWGRVLGPGPSSVTCYLCDLGWVHLPLWASLGGICSLNPYQPFTTQPSQVSPRPRCPEAEVTLPTSVSQVCSVSPPVQGILEAVG